MSFIDHFQNIELTRDQSLAVERIQEFLGNGLNVFFLKGYAGTGKTFLLNGLTKYLQAQKKHFRLMTPTGRAAMILGQKTGLPAFTIHKSIYNYKELEEDESSFKLYFGLNMNQDPTSTVYIIDEASMLSDKHAEDDFFIFGSGYLLKDFFNYINFHQRQKAKVIFIGDHAQLPPVNMNFSPALSLKYLKEQYQINGEEFELTEVVRYKKESGILEVATELRNSIKNKEFNRFSVPGNLKDIKQVIPVSFLGT